MSSLELWTAKGRGSMADAGLRSDETMLKLPKSTTVKNKSAANRQVTKPLMYPDCPFYTPPPPPTLSTSVPPSKQTALCSLADAKVFRARPADYC